MILALALSMGLILSGPQFAAFASPQNSEWYCSHRLKKLNERNSLYSSITRDVATQFWGPRSIYGLFVVEDCLYTDGAAQGVSVQLKVRAEGGPRDHLCLIKYKRFHKSRWGKWQYLDLVCRRSQISSPSSGSPDEIYDPDLSERTPRYGGGPDDVSDDLSGGDYPGPVGGDSPGDGDVGDIYH